VTKQLQSEELFIGIDLHKRRWHLTVKYQDIADPTLMLKSVRTSLTLR